MPSPDAKQYFSEMVRALLAIIENKDASLRKNSERIAQAAKKFCIQLNLPRGETERVYLAALLHDIGMINISSDIINKSEKLTEGEFAMIKLHPEISEKIISNLSFLKSIVPIVRHHHEAFDGSGYPDGARGKDIPLGSRILCITESHDVLINGRPYRKPVDGDAALEDLKQNAGKRYDPKLVAAFEEHLVVKAASGQANERTQENEKKNDVRSVIDSIAADFKKGKITLPALPQVVYDIQQVIKNPTSNADAIAQVIEKDSVTSLRLITVSNSASYRGTDKIQTVRQAVTRLGLKQTQSIVNAIANKGLYKTDNEQFQEIMEKLWKHSLATAYAGKSVAMKIGLEDEEKFFLMGLVHDIGKILLFNPLTKIIDKSDSLDLQEIIKTIQGIHTDFSGALLERLGFAQEFARVGRMHEGPHFSDATQKEILVVNLANNIARKIGCSVHEDGDIDLAELESAHLLELDAEGLNGLCEEVNNIMQESSHAF